MSSLNVSLMFSQVPQPLRYAEALLQRFATLARAANSDALLGGLVESAAQLSGSELSQLYLLDDTHTRLTLSAEWQDGLLQPRADASLSSDYDGEQLLQYCLCQNQTLSLNELDSSLHQTGFLPEAQQPWRSLLCQPLLDEQKGVTGLLLIASQRSRELQGFADSLGHLGSFVVAQARLLQRLHHLQGEAIIAAPVAVANPRGYGLIGNSPRMQAVYQLIGKVLHSPINVLITGETGTGKELVARAIHEHGVRRNKPFVVQNCASLPENLLESELFGYLKGAFTGADSNRKGLFDAADGGTLFLDEIGDMPLALQAKLLRVLQEGEVRPLGNPHPHKVDVRIIAATHRNLRDLVEAGRFREDLFYRLTHFPIDLPALRVRDNDIQLLAQHFCANANKNIKHNACQWSAEALDLLANHPFPGNVRELKGMVERAVLLCEGSELLPEHFNVQAEPGHAAGVTHLRDRLEQFERNLVLASLRRNQWQMGRVASELGLPYRTLNYRMKRLKINTTDA